MTTDEHDPHATHDHEPHDHDDPHAHQHVAADLFNHVWSLLELSERTSEQDDEMLHAAHASRYHWSRARMHDEPTRLAVGEWQCSRVYSVLERGEPSLHHARRALALCERHGLGDWVLAAAHEAMARASGVAGDRDGAARWLEMARASTAAISEDEDRVVIERDLASLG